MPFFTILSIVWLAFCVCAQQDSFKREIGLSSPSYGSVYSNPYITAIRKELTTYLEETSWRDSLRKLNVRVADHLVQDTTCKSYYADCFSVVHIWPGEFGGINGYIIFKNRPDRIFRVWVYKIDDNEYQLRQIEPVSYTKAEVDSVRRKFGDRLFMRCL